MSFIITPIAESPRQWQNTRSLLSPWWYLSSKMSCMGCYRLSHRVCLFRHMNGMVCPSLFDWLLLLPVLSGEFISVQRGNERLWWRTDETSISPAGDNISDVRLERQGACITWHAEYFETGMIWGYPNRFFISFIRYNSGPVESNLIFYRCLKYTSKRTWKAIPHSISAPDTIETVHSWCAVNVKSSILCLSEITSPVQSYCQILSSLICSDDKNRHISSLWNEPGRKLTTAVGFTRIWPVEGVSKPHSKITNNNQNIN